MESYGFLTDVTKKAIKIYIKFYGKNPVRKSIIFGCFCVVWDEYEIRKKNEITRKISAKRTRRRFRKNKMIVGEMLDGFVTAVTFKTLDTIMPDRALGSCIWNGND